MKHKTADRRPRNPYATAVRKLKMRVKTSARAYSRKAKHPNPRPQDGGSSFAGTAIPAGTCTEVRIG
jgi:hypothetical protein